ncbi:membrane protein [Sinorhizobium americanum]|uniref:Membrane protein n=1 Tax=Sinorhizobium americanum TaxID=194963 RepID=A0A1L3LLP7_9HYPH|nr:membrane protein [Sinorhizobium americanum]
MHGLWSFPGAWTRHSSLSGCQNRSTPFDGGRRPNAIHGLDSQCAAKHDGAPLAPLRLGHGNDQAVRVEMASDARLTDLDEAPCCIFNPHSNWSHERAVALADERAGAGRAYTHGAKRQRSRGDRLEAGTNHAARPIRNRSRYHRVRHGIAKNTLLVFTALAEPNLYGPKGRRQSDGWRRARRGSNASNRSCTDTVWRPALLWSSSAYDRTSQSTARSRRRSLAFRHRGSSAGTRQFAATLMADIAAGPTVFPSLYAGRGSGLRSASGTRPWRAATPATRHTTSHRCPLIACSATAFSRFCAGRRSGVCPASGAGF